MKETKFGSGSGFIREETNSNIVCDVYLFGSFYLFVCLLRFSYKYQIFLNAQPFTLVGRHGIMVFLLKTSRGTEFLPSQRDDKHRSLTFLWGFPPGLLACERQTYFRSSLLRSPSEKLFSARRVKLETKAEKSGCSRRLRDYGPYEKTISSSSEICGW